ncbi:MAG: agmatinase [Spirochaetes bacterium]|nr:agmatinase [Spirochaetota bacterium]
MKKKYRYTDAADEFCGYEKSGTVIVPVPYDGTSTWMKGADKGPDAIFEASQNMYWYDIETGSEPYNKGIFTDSPVREKRSPEKMTDTVYQRVSGHLKNGKFVVTVGGEHSVSVGAIRAHSEKHAGMSVLQLDAHADLQPSFHGSRYNHACAMARAREFCPVVHAGIRSIDDIEMSAAEPGAIFFAEDIRNNRKWVKKALKRLTRKVYVTIDVDVFDISIMPATGTPEPGGLGWYDVLHLLKKTADEKEIVGFDIVELCPNKYSRPYDFLAAKLLYKMLCYKFYR